MISLTPTERRYFLAIRRFILTGKRPSGKEISVAAGGDENGRSVRRMLDKLSGKGLLRYTYGPIHGAIQGLTIKLTKLGREMR